MKAIASILLLISWFASAQQSAGPVTAKPRMFYGILLGGNFSNLYLNGSSGSDSPGLGYRVGISASYEPSTRLFFQGSVAFLMEKHSADFGTYGPGNYASNGPLVVDYKFYWAEMPITVNYIFIRKKQASVFIGTGVSLRRFFNYGYNVTSGQAYNFQPVDNINTWNIFPIIELGTSIETSDRRRMGALVSYQTNAMKLYHTVVLSSGSTLPAPDVKLSSINLTVWYSISL